MADENVLNLKPHQRKALLLILAKKWIMLFGGRRSGKSFVIIFFMLLVCNLYDKSKKIPFLKDITVPPRMAVLRYKFTDVRKFIINDTLPKVAALLNMQYKLDQQQWVVRLGTYKGNEFIANGSEIWFGGLDEGRGLDRVLGGEYLIIWLNEISEISYSALETIKSSLAQKTGFTNKHLLYYENIREWLGVKEGDPNDPFSGEMGELSSRILTDQNPPKKSHWSYKLFVLGINPEDRVLVNNFNQYGFQQMNPHENEGNIDKDYLEVLNSLSESKKKRFLYGEFEDDDKGALFTETNINQYRTITHPELKRIVIAVDPSITSKATSDDVGIIVAGIGFDDRGYILEDSSGIMSPADWAEKVYKKFIHWDADKVVAEANQGGDLVERNINVEYPNIPVVLVWATKGKILRAEPISTLYAKGRISHVGSFPDLEYEMTTYLGLPTEKSPNRLDAMVYALTELFPVGLNSQGNVFGSDKIKYYDQLPDGSRFAVIKILNNKSYNFIFVSAVVNSGMVFIDDVIYNQLPPINNFDEVNRIIKETKIKHLIVEADISFGEFTVYLSENIKDCVVDGAILPFDSGSRILMETNHIRDYFIFPKETKSEDQKQFVREINMYTNLSVEEDYFSVNVCACMSSFYKEINSETNLFK